MRMQYCFKSAVVKIPFKNVIDFTDKDQDAIVIASYKV